MIKSQFLRLWKTARILNYLSRIPFNLLLITSGILTPENFFYLSFMFISSSLFFILLIWKELWLICNIIMDLEPKMRFSYFVNLLRLEYSWCFYFMKYFKQKQKVNNISLIFGTILKFSDFLYLEQLE